MEKLGLREPYRVTPNDKFIFNEDTGMEYEQYSDQFGELYMTALHEDVGQVTWYKITENEWQQLSNEDKD